MKTKSVCQTKVHCHLISSLAIVLTCAQIAAAEEVQPGAEQAPEGSIGTVKHANIEEFEYHPPEVRVRPGTTVVWTNQDRFRHDVMVLAKNSPAPADLKSPLVGYREKIAIKFDVPGTYTYICSVHPFMQATVIVAEDAVESGAAERPEREREEKERTTSLTGEGVQ